VVDDGKVARSFIEFVQAPFRAHPHAARSVFRDSEYPVAGDGGGVGGFIKVFFKPVAVEFIEPILCAEPDEAFRILEDAFDFAL
jgi:hypothetical protein